MLGHVVGKRGRGALGDQTSITTSVGLPKKWLPRNEGANFRTMTYWKRAYRSIGNFLTWMDTECERGRWEIGKNTARISAAAFLRRGEE